MSAVSSNWYLNGLNSNWPFAIDLLDICKDDCQLVLETNFEKPFAFEELMTALGLSATL